MEAAVKYALMKNLVSHVAVYMQGFELDNDGMTCKCACDVTVH